MNKNENFSFSSVIQKFFLKEIDGARNIYMLLFI